MVFRFEAKDFQQMDVEQVRASTPLRKRSPTPLDRLRSREPSPFVMPKLKLGSGTITPGGSKPSDPHTFFSRSSSSQSLHQGGGGFGTQLDFDSFRAAMEAKQAEDDSLPQVSASNTQPTYSHSMRNLSWKGGPSSTLKQDSQEHLCPDSTYNLERPGSAMSQMSEMSIYVGDHDLPSRADSRMEAVPLGDAISHGNLHMLSNLSSRRGSEQQGFKENKYVSSWLNKNNQDFERDDLKTPINDPTTENVTTAVSLKKDIADLEAEIQNEDKKDKVNLDSTRPGSQAKKLNVGQNMHFTTEDSEIKVIPCDTNEFDEQENFKDTKSSTKTMNEEPKVKSRPSSRSEICKKQAETIQDESSTQKSSMRSSSRNAQKTESLQKESSSKETTSKMKEDSIHKKVVSPEQEEKPSNKAGNKIDSYDQKKEIQDQEFSHKNLRPDQKVKTQQEETSTSRSDSKLEGKDKSSLRPGSKLEEKQSNSSKFGNKEEISVSSLEENIASSSGNKQEEAKISEPEHIPSGPATKFSGKQDSQQLNNLDSSQQSGIEKYQEEITNRPKSKLKEKEEVSSRPRSKSRGKEGEATRPSSQTEEIPARPNSKLSKKENESSRLSPARPRSKSRGNLEDSPVQSNQLEEVPARPGSKLRGKEKESTSLSSKIEEVPARPGSKLRGKEEEVSAAPKSKSSWKEEENMSPSSQTVEEAPTRPGSKVTGKEQEVEEAPARPGSKVRGRDQESSRPDSQLEEVSSRPRSKLRGSEQESSRPNSQLDEVSARPGSKLRGKEQDSSRPSDPLEEAHAKPASKLREKEEETSRPSSQTVEEAPARPGGNIRAKELESLRPGSQTETQSLQSKTVGSFEINEDTHKKEPKSISRPSSRSQEIPRPSSRVSELQDLAQSILSEDEDDSAVIMSMQESDQPIRPSRLETEKENIIRLNSRQEEKEKSSSRPGSNLEEDQRPGSKHSKKEDISDFKENVASRPGSKMKETSEPELKCQLEFTEEEVLPTRPRSKLKGKQQEQESSRPGSQTEKRSFTETEQRMSRPSSKMSGQQEPDSRSSSRNEKTSNQDETKSDLSKTKEKWSGYKSPILQENIDESLIDNNQITEVSTEKKQKKIRTLSSSSSGFEQVEPAEWYQSEEHDEDELMIILDTDTIEEEEELKHTLGFQDISNEPVDIEAMEQLELQYEIENGKRSRLFDRENSRPSSAIERPPSILKASREASNERSEKDEKSRPGSRSSMKENLLDKKKISFDDDFQPETLDQKKENDEASLKSRSQSRERPGSRSSLGSLKGPQDHDRKKSSSLVPELETIEIPASLKEKLDRIEQSEPNSKYEKERADSPRPPSRPSSTGFSQLDEFERKLAEMETELQNQDEIEKGEDSVMKRRNNMWNLVDDEIAKERTYDGFFVNKEGELGNLDHSMVVGEEILEEDLKSKKVSFAASDERYEIQRPGEVRTLGKNLYSLSPPKPMRKLPGKDDGSNDGEHFQTPAEVEKGSLKEASVEKERSKSFMSSLTGSLRRSRSKTPDTEKDNSSFFGSLLRKGKWGSRSGSRQSSVDRESQGFSSDMEGRTSRASDAGSTDSLVMKIKKLGKKKPKQVSTTDFDELFARGRAMSTLNDSEQSLTEKSEREHKKSRRTIPKDDSIDYNEKVQAFLEDQAKTTQQYKAKKEEVKPKIEKRIIDTNIEEKLKNLEPETPVTRKVSSYAKPEEIKLSPVVIKKDPFSGRALPQSPDEEFLEKITDFVTNYSQKPNYEQIWPKSPSKPQRPKRSQKLRSKETSIVKDITLQSSSVDSTSNISTVSPAVPEPVEAVEQKDESHKDDIAPKATEADTSVNEMDFLDKVSTFVTQYSDSDDYKQKMWPEKESTKLETKKKKTMSPGRSYLEYQGEVEWFAQSIEADSVEAKKQVSELDKRNKSKEKVVKNNLSTGAALMRQHLSSTSATSSPTTTHVESSHISPKNMNEKSSTIPVSPPQRQNQRISSSQPPPELPSETLLKGGPRPSSSQSQVSNQEFYTKLVMGLQKYTTPEPESRSTISSPKIFPDNLKKSQSETQIKPEENTRKTEIKSKVSSQEVSGDKNQEFFSKLVTGLKEMTTDQDQPKSNQDTDIYRKYSHHLGRAEFGSLKRRESMESNTSNLRHTSSFKETSRQSRDSSYDKISTKLSLSRKVSRQDSGEKYVRGQSRMSDTSEAMPDLEVDDELESALSKRIGDSSQVEFKSPSLGNKP